MPAQENMNNSINELNWLDIFYGMLVHPLKTLAMLSDSNLYPPILSALLSSILIVILTAMANSCVTVSSFSSEGLLLNATTSILSDMFFWLVLAIFARLLAAAMKVSTNMRTCLIVTGWAFVPLLLKAPVACIANVSILGDTLSLIISAWFLVLVFFAFDSLLKLGKLKTLVFILILPPCLFFSYFVAMIFASKYIIDGFF